MLAWTRRKENQSSPWDCPITVGPREPITETRKRGRKLALVGRSDFSILLRLSLRNLRAVHILVEDCTPLKYFKLGVSHGEDRAGRTDQGVHR